MWNSGSPPRARLAALLCARVAAATRRRRTRAGGPRSRAEDEEAKAETDGIATALGLAAEDGRANAGGGRPSKRRRGSGRWRRRRALQVLVQWCCCAGRRVGYRSTEQPAGGFAFWTARSTARLDESGQPTTNAAAWPNQMSFIKRHKMLSHFRRELKSDRARR
jgi:hypothetical protein